MTTHYFLGTRLLASTPTPARWNDHDPIAGPTMLVCPTCGEIWARVVTDHGEWLPIRAGCPLHPYLHPVGGSFIAPWRHTFNEFPQAVLEYEFDLHFNHYLRNQHAPR